MADDGCHDDAADHTGDCRRILKADQTHAIASDASSVSSNVFSMAETIWPPTVEQLPETETHRAEQNSFSTSGADTSSGAARGHSRT
jgi:hypothetical protein